MSHAEVAGSGRNYGGTKADGKGKVGVSTASSGLLRLFRRCPAANLAPYRHFIVADRHVGWVDPDFARALAEFPAVFYLTDRTVRLHDRLDDVEARSAAVADVLAKLHERGHVPGWRGELYPEDVLVCLAALRLRRPVKWVEDRRENLLATNHSREQYHFIRAASSLRSIPVWARRRCC